MKTRKPIATTSRVRIALRKDTRLQSMRCALPHRSTTRSGLFVPCQSCLRRSFTRPHRSFAYSPERETPPLQGCATSLGANDSGSQAPAVELFGAYYSVGNAKDQNCAGDAGTVQGNAANQEKCAAHYRKECTKNDARKAILV